MTSGKGDMMSIKKQQLKEEKEVFGELMTAADNLIVFRCEVASLLHLLHCDPELEELQRGVLQVAMAKQVELQDLAFRRARRKRKHSEQLH
jgi:hypothetical protein